MKFPIEYFFSKSDQIRSLPRIWSHLLKKFLMQSFIFCAVMLWYLFHVAEKNIRTILILVQCLLRTLNNLRMFVQHCSFTKTWFRFLFCFSIYFMNRLSWMKLRDEAEWRWGMNRWSWKMYRNSRSDVLQNRCFEKFHNIHRKTHVLESLFNITPGLKACNFIKGRLQHMCFPVNIAKFLRTAEQLFS